MTNYFEPKSPALAHAGARASDFKLANIGLTHLGKVYWNLPVPALYEEAIFRGEGHMVSGGPFVVNTGKFSARAAQDKCVVREDSTEDEIWWGVQNRPMSVEKFSGLHARLAAFWQGEDLFVQDCVAGADPEYGMRVRVVTDHAWQSHFARNMLEPVRDPEAQRTFVPEFTVLAAPGFKADPKIDGTRSETVIAINFAQRLAVICGTGYGGEIKKTVFTVLNFLLPRRDVLGMHCSANVGDEGDVALFFGLSGTGKTTLSADPKRRLIGDDEHGWSDDAVFNFENGCYAKVIRLSSEAEPEIHATTHRYGTILENVVWDPATRNIDLDDDQFTENTRASYPLSYIDNVVEERMARSHPKNIILLTADAQGVLPPIAKLTPEQAIYHFISGYTSKIAGTEIGLGIEPQITFSACFGAPFMVHHPYVYAKLLEEKMERYGVHCWLVNTGWVGGRFGVGKRISIRHTRGLLNAALEGKLLNVDYRVDALFGFRVPLTCPGVPEEVLRPEQSWANQDEYWKVYDGLTARYIENFKLFEAACPPDVVNHGPKRLRAVR